MNFKKQEVTVACITVWLCPVNLTDSRAVFAAGSSRRREQWSTGSFIFGIGKKCYQIHTEYIENLVSNVYRDRYQ